MRWHTLGHRVITGGVVCFQPGPIGISRYYSIIITTLLDRTNIRAENTKTQVYLREALLGYSFDIFREHSHSWLERAIDLEESYRDIQEGNVCRRIVMGCCLFVFLGLCNLNFLCFDCN